MSNHTRGPWAVYSGPNIVRVSDEEAISVALVSRRRDEWEANAALIAAAPDLLEELETAIAWIEERGQPSAIYAPTAEQILPQLRAAIAKAKPTT